MMSQPSQMTRLLLLLPMLLLGGCIVPARGDPPPARSVPVTRVRASDVIASANEARARRGFDALVSDASLNAAAQDFADELARRNVLTHTSDRRGYGTLMQRIDRAGATGIVRAGENVGMMSVRADMADEIVTMWLQSAGHRRSLLDPAYRLTGAGIARGSRNAWYFVQIYAARGTRR